MQHCGFDPPLRRIFSGRGDFSHGVNMGSDSIPQKLFQISIYKQGSSLRKHSCPRWVNASNKNTPSMHHPGRWNVTTSMVGLENGHIHKNLTQNGEPQGYSWGRQKKKE